MNKACIAHTHTHKRQLQGYDRPLVTQLYVWTTIISFLVMLKPRPLDRDLERLREYHNLDQGIESCATHD